MSDEQRLLALKAGVEVFCKQAAATGFDWKNLLGRIWGHIRANPMRYAGAGLGALTGGLLGRRRGMPGMLGGALMGGAAGYGLGSIGRSLTQQHTPGVWSWWNRLTQPTTRAAAPEKTPVRATLPAVTPSATSLGEPGPTQLPAPIQSPARQVVPMTPAEMGDVIGEDVPQTAMSEEEMRAYVALRRAAAQRQQQQQRTQVATADPARMGLGLEEMTQ